MHGVLSHPVFARLFGAQVVALMGTGLLTIALGLLAFDLAGDRAGAVLGIALTIKMVAYVGIAPLMAALVAGLDRRRVLIAADLVRAAAALSLPFIDAVWQIYVAVFVLQAASATFTPTFQSVIPDVLTEEAEYTRALSLSRLAYDLENVLSPALAGLALAVISFHELFYGTVIGFAASAALVMSVRVPEIAGAVARPFRDRLTRGARIYLGTPRLRGLLALNGAVSAIGAVPLVLTVVIARGIYGGGETALAWAMGAYGAGSMAAALALPRVLDRTGDRPVMLAAGAAGGILLGAAGLGIVLGGWPGWPVVLALWAGLGLCSAAILTPSGRLLRRSAHQEDRPAVFTAQFALSHACWLVAYPVSGLFGTAAGAAAAMALFGAAALACTLAAVRLWPEDTARAIPHWHPDLPPDHPHLRAHGQGRSHAHVYVIDDHHRHWPAMS